MAQIMANDSATANDGATASDRVYQWQCPGMMAIDSRFLCSMTQDTVWIYEVILDSELC